MRNKVSIRVNSRFFDEFERERKKLERSKGVRFSQAKFTEYLIKKNFKFRIPKTNKKHEKLIPRRLR